MAIYKFQFLTKNALWQHFMDNVMCFHLLVTFTHYTFWKSTNPWYDGKSTTFDHEFISYVIFFVLLCCLEIAQTIGAPYCALGTFGKPSMEMGAMKWFLNYNVRVIEI
jgi:hypothetical protein